MRLTRKRAWWGGGVAVVLVAGLLTWAFWPSTPAPRARQYIDYNACLLTDSQGLSGQAAKSVWAGMQQASLTTHARMQYLAIVGPQTADNAAVTLNTLALRKCSLIFAAGPLASTAAQARARAFPGVRFYVQGDATTGNLTSIPTGPDDAVRKAVDQAIVGAVQR